MRYKKLGILLSLNYWYMNSSSLLIKKRPHHHQRNQLLAVETHHVRLKKESEPFRD
jgi:hypothetical protein